MQSGNLDVKNVILTEVGEAAFNAEFRKAASGDLHELPDGRPAIMTQALFGEVHVTTMYPMVWDRRKSRVGQTNRAVGSAERGCPTCGCTMVLTNELETTWSFWCPDCKTVETWGKQIIGGTIGAGEKEKA